MKKVIQILAIAVVVLVPVILSAQPMPYDPGVGGGEINNPVGGAAPLGEGIILLLSMGMGYAVRKYRQIRKLN